MRMEPDRVDVVAPNLKRRLSGVTATVVRLVPVQAKGIGMAVVGPGLPEDLPRLSWSQVATLRRDRPRVWHARRNTEMLLGLTMRHLLRRRFRLLFTSAAQRHHSRYTRWLIDQMDEVVATSRQAVLYLQRPATVVPHGVDLAVFQPSEDRAALREASDLPAGVWIGCFGRVRPQKGTDVLIDALLRLMPERPWLRCLLVGREDDAPFAAELRERIVAAGLSDRFRWDAHLSWEDLASRHRAMDLHVAPQRWEGFGLTPLEAMASGVAVVATRVGAFPDLLVDGETGTLVPPGDVEAMTRAIGALVDDVPRLEAMGRRARVHVEAHHGIRAEADALEAIYRRLLGRD